MKRLYLPAEKGLMEAFQNWKLPERITACFLAVMCSFYLFFADKTGYLQIVQAKQRAFYWIAGGYLLLMSIYGVVLCAVQRRWPQVKTMWRQAAWTQRLAVCYLVLTLFSTVFSRYPSESFFGMKRAEGLLTIGLYVFCFLLVSVYGRLREWLIYFCGGAMMIFSCICLIQMRGYNPFGLYPDGFSYFDKDVKYSGAYLGTVGNVDLVAALLCIFIAVFFVSLVRLQKKRRVLLLLPLTLCMLVLLQMDVKAGLAGVFIGGIVMLPVVLPLGPKARRGLIIGFAGLLTVLAVILWFYDFGGSGTLYEAHALLRGEADDSHGTGRIYIWRKTLEILWDAPLFGGGPDTLSLRLDATFRRYDPVLNLNLVAAVDVAHNEYLNILVNQGIPALLVYVGALAASFLQWIKSSAKNPAAAICGAAILCYCIQAFFGISMLMTAPYFWLAWGLLICAVKKGTHRP